MQSNDFYVILSFFLLAVLALLGAYGVIGYRMYLRQNAKQLNDIVNDYKKLANDSNELANNSNETLEKGVKTMIELIKHLEGYKNNN
jgi:predicted negative regulator of RcsB-dependent stress response